jgi:hypothetical protein
MVDAERRCVQCFTDTLFLEETLPTAERKRGWRMANPFEFMRLFSTTVSSTFTTYHKATCISPTCTAQHRHPLPSADIHDSLLPLRRHAARADQTDLHPSVAQLCGHQGHGGPSTSLSHGHAGLDSADVTKVITDFFLGRGASLPHPPRAPQHSLPPSHQPQLGPPALRGDVWRTADGSARLRLQVHCRGRRRAADRIEGDQCPRPRRTSVCIVR